MPLPLDRRCPCGTGDTYGDCCAVRHDGSAPAPTAEALMRARFSAFALGDAGYLRASWHPSTRPRSLTLEEEQRWTRLDVLATSRGGLTDDTGTVEFRAWFRDAAGRGALHEHSRFARDAGRWAYVGPVPGTVPDLER